MRRGEIEDMKFFYAAAVTLLAANGFAAADPGLLNLVMPDAKVVAGIDVQKTLASPFGKYLLAEFPINNNALVQFASATGFDFRTDLTQIVTASDAAQNSRDGLVLARGTFEPARFFNLAAFAGSAKETYLGIDLLTTPQGALAFPDGSTAIFGTMDMVKGAIDRFNAHAAFAGQLASQVQAVSAASEAWVVTAAPLSTWLPQNDPQRPGLGGLLNRLGSIQDTAFSLQLGTDAVTLSGKATTGSDQDAQTLAGILKFAVGMMLSNQGRNPQAGQAATLFQNAQFSANGPVLQLSLSVPEQQMEQLVSQPHTRKVAKRQF